MPEGGGGGVRGSLPLFSKNKLLNHTSKLLCSFKPPFIRWEDWEKHSSTPNLIILAGSQPTFHQTHFLKTRSAAVYYDIKWLLKISFIHDLYVPWKIFFMFSIQRNNHHKLVLWPICRPLLRGYDKNHLIKQHLTLCSAHTSVAACNYKNSNVSTWHVNWGM